MSQTFIASSDTLSSYQSGVVLPSVAMEERNPHRAHLALFNTTGSNSIVRIREISVTPKAFEGVTINTTSLIQITAASNGNTVTPFPLDSTSASFPSTVEVRTNCLNVTAVSGGYVKAQTSTSSLLGTATGYPLAKKNILNRWRDATTAETQKATMRNGQGIAIIEANNPNTYNFPVIINATIRLSDTGACHQITAFAFTNAPSLFSVFNNGYTAGNVELLNISVDAVRGGTAVGNTADINPHHTIALLEGFNPSVNGEVITEKKFDSANTLNSYIKLYKNLDVGYFFARTGNLATNALMFRTVPQSSRVATPMFTPYKKVLFKSRGAENDLIIREGNGIAVLQPDAGAYGSAYDIDVVFTQESTSASAIFPGVGDVDLAIQYGPNGTDYTGTLVQPAVGDVKTGTQYGASGTEFTGTYTGGGGGGFISIINE